ncbi:MAG: class I adenylate-forming enzyme family protein [Sphingomicrobium sp.]
MPSELDRRFDRKMAEVNGPGGVIGIGHDDKGQAIATNMPATIPGLLAAFCKVNAEHEAIVAGDERLLFPEVAEWSGRLARSLVARGIRKGDRVGIAMRNCPAWIVCYFAILEAGGIATLLNGWWECRELDYALKLTEPVLVITDEPRSRRIADCSAEVETLILPIDKPLGEALAPLLNVAGADEAKLPEIAPEDDATILFTSGSTGDSKGAVSTHRAVTTAAYTYANALVTLLGLLVEEGRPPAGKPRVLLAVPLFHVTGEVPVMLTSFVIGRCMVMMPKWDSTEALRLIEKERITYFVGVPTMSLELMTDPRRTEFDCSSMTDIAAGGAPRPVSHVGRLKEAFPLAQPGLGYGLTESNAVGAQNMWTNYADKPASTGRPHAPFVEMAILGKGDRHLPAGEVGEIAIRTAANIRGYWKSPEATADLFTPDFYVRSGDIGYLDKDGYLFIVDRKKDIIIRGGENIASAEVEAACYACPEVSEVSVFGTADERLGEVPVAVIYSEDGISEDRLRGFLEGRIAKYKVPERFIFSTEPLPKLGTGKIDRRSLKEQYAR